jgi:hypothetical protein
MGNRISDIGTMRSNVDAENRINMFAKKTARLGGSGKKSKNCCGR